MNTRFLLAFALYFAPFLGLSQALEFKDVDTLKFDSRTGGQIDTFDLAYSFPYTILPSTGFSNRFQTPNVDFLARRYNLIDFGIPSLPTHKVFSALPHIGFTYSFGSKGTQYLHADYQQYFRSNTLINATVDRQSSNGFIPNSAYSNSSAKMALYGNYGCLNVVLQGVYSSDDRNLYEGLDSNIIEKIDTSGLTIDFASPTNSFAQTTQKSTNSKLLLQYNILSDSALIKAGPQFTSQYALWNRVYSNEDDSLRDQFQDATISSGLGLFFERQRLIEISLSGVHRYWRFQNLGTNRDTNEFSLQGHLLIKKKKMALEVDYYQNIIGALGESRLNGRFRLGIGSQKIEVFLKMSNELPIPVQRNYFGEYIAYNTSLTKQQRINAGVNGDFILGKTEFDLRLGILNTSNNLVWADSLWAINNLSQLNLSFLDAKAHLNFGSFHWYPQIVLQIGSEYLPQFIFAGRFLYKKKVFDAKKLELQFSIDPQINSKYKLLSYNLNLDNYHFDSANRTGGNPYALNSTFSLGIQEFRFFVRGENLQYFWMQQSPELLQDYYGTPFVLRLGLSWDFFN